MSTVPAKVLQDYISEGNSSLYNFSYASSLTGSTLSFVMIKEPVANTGVVVATANGTGANVTQEISLQTSTLATGIYYLEVYKDLDATGQALVFPPNNVCYKIAVQERYAI